MLHRMTYARAIENVEHLIAIGETTVYIDDDHHAPWDKASRIEPGGTYRFNGPTNFYVIAEDSGLTFKWTVDMEECDASGRGVSLFDRDRLREVMRRLPADARYSLATFFQEKVLPDLRKRTDEIRAALNQQLDSEDCVRGLMAYAADPKAAAA